jgi:2-polyprenyl-6-methoxyphenol hydroxylase-like FAD-dependent oxidoreductase
MTDEAETAPVVIVGAGPTGLMLAIELHLAGLTPLVLDRLPEPSGLPKGNGLFGQIVRFLDYRGLLEEFRAESPYCGPVPGFAFGPLALEFGPIDQSPLHVLAIPQRRIEHLLAGRLRSLGGTVSRGLELTGLAPDDDGVSLDLLDADGATRQLRAAYVVGCDGARSAVRKLTGIGFPGITSDEISRIGRVRLPETMIVPGTGEVDVPGAGRLQPMRQVRTATGGYSIGPLTSLDKEAEPRIYIVATREEGRIEDAEAEMTLAELQDSLDRVLGARLPLSEPRWLTRTVGNSRIAERFRSGRVLLAGDAAHLSGLGGGLNGGLMDAANLGWKLAASVRGDAPAGLLDSYDTERRAAAERTQLQSRAQRALGRADDLSLAVRDLLAELLAREGAARTVGAMIEGSDVRYDMPGSPASGHPLPGRLTPDLALMTGSGPTRIAGLLRAARPVLLDFTPDGRAATAASAWAGPLTILTATPLDPPPADALLIRPDGYVAWAASGDSADTERGLQTALAAWCPRPATGARG